MVTKSISVETAIINLHPNDRGRRGQIVGGNIRLAPCAERLPFCITIMSITQTTAALTKSATIPFFMEVRYCYRSVYVNPFRQAQFQAYALSRSNYHHALSMFYLGKNSFRNISLILKTAFNIKVSHTTVSNWCVKFAPLFDDMRIQLVSLLDLNSDECTPMKR